MKLYKDSYNKFWIENETCPSGVYSISFSEDNLICLIRNISTQAIKYNGLVTGVLKENGGGYTNRTDLESAVSDFFVDAPVGGGLTVEIVNDLTTGGVTKALSAEQGKVLQNAKMNRLTNGNGAIDINAIMTLVGLGFDLSNAYLPYASLPNAYLSGAYLPDADLSNADLFYTYLAHAYLYGANFSGAKLNGTNFEGADLTNANFENADFYGAYLSGASLSGANFENVGFYGAYLSGASLSGANFENGGFYGGDLTNADLSGANFEMWSFYCDLTNADFSSATGLDANINIALADVNKDPNGNGIIWTLTWTDSLTYSCDPSTGLFTLAS